jgi:alkanesulfonate monooxygenase
MEFGIRIPSYAWPDLTYERTRRLLDYARKVEELGFDSIWVIEHLLVAPAIYGVSWLEPLTTLAYVAGVTERVKIGTGILVLPLRHPVMLAKEVATMDYLTGGRFILGVGPGWDPKEFEAMGLRLSERGKRTDEILAALRLLLTRDNVTFQGQFYSFTDITIEPRPSKLPPIWVAGGSLTHAPDAPDKPYIAPSVLRRVVQADAWLSRSSGSDQEDVKRDWQEIQAYARSVGRDPSTILFAHTQFIHIVDTDDRDRAIEIQGPKFAKVMGDRRSFQDLAASYLMGTVDDMVARLMDLKKAGLQYVLLTPVTDEIEQLYLIKEKLVSRLQ